MSVYEKLTMCESRHTGQKSDIADWGKKLTRKILVGAGLFLALEFAVLVFVILLRR